MNRVTVIGVVVFLMFSASIPDVTCGVSNPSDVDSTHVSSTTYPEKMPRRETWEHLVSFPGTMVMLPLRLGYKSVNVTVTSLLLPQRVGAVYDFLHSDDGLRAAEPTFKERYGAGFKIYQKNLLNEDSKLEFKAMAWDGYRQRYQLKFDTIHFPDRFLYADVLLNYQMLPDENFYGIGPLTKKDDDKTFLHEQSYVSVSFGRTLSKDFAFSCSFRFEQNNIRGDRHQDEDSITKQYTLEELPGLESRVKLWGMGGEITYDSRNVKGRPSSGQEILIGGDFVNQFSRDDYGFWKVRADVRQYIHLFYGRILMFRIAGELTEPVSGKKVPFYHLSELGKSETVRGFNRGRFRDLEMVMASVEYFFPVWFTKDGAVDAFLFCDAGQVAHTVFEDFQTEDVQVGYGFGLRFSGPYAEALRVMLGVSKERVRLYLDFNI
jgi:outer membrane protein assembly factor BamA